MQITFNFMKNVNVSIYIPTYLYLMRQIFWMAMCTVLENGNSNYKMLIFSQCITLNIFLIVWNYFLVFFTPDILYFNLSESKNCFNFSKNKCTIQIQSTQYKSNIFIIQHLSIYLKHVFITLFRFLFDNWYCILWCYRFIFYNNEHPFNKIA